MNNETRNKVQLVRDALGDNAEALQALCDINQELLMLISDLAEAQDDLEEKSIRLGEIAHG